MTFRPMLVLAMALLCSFPLFAHAQSSISLNGFSLGMSAEDARDLVSRGGWRSHDGGEVVFPDSKASAEISIEPADDSTALVGCDEDRKHCARIAGVTLSFDTGRLAAVTMIPESVPIERSRELVSFARGIISLLTENHGEPTRAPVTDMEKALSTMSTRTKYAPLILAVWSWKEDDREVASITVQGRAFTQGTSTVAQVSVQMRGR